MITSNTGLSDQSGSAKRLSPLAGSTTAAGGLAAERAGGRPPQVHVAAEEVGLGAHQPVGLGGELAHHLGQGRRDVEGVGTERRRPVGLRSAASAIAPWAVIAARARLSRQGLQRLALGAGQRAERGAGAYAGAVAGRGGFGLRP